LNAPFRPDWLLRLSSEVDRRAGTTKGRSLHPADAFPVRAEYARELLFGGESPRSLERGFCGA
jgi:hypothetical protein